MIEAGLSEPGATPAQPGAPETVADPSVQPAVPSPTGGIKTVGRGVLMGLTDAVPGVSGGTIALILGIHPRLVHAIASLDLTMAKAAWQARRQAARAAFVQRLREADTAFLVLLGLGLVAGLIAGAKVIVRLLDAVPQAMAAAFLALVITGAAVPWRHADRSARGLMVLAIAAAFAFLLGLAEGERAVHAWALPAYGALAACAMILPGISGSYVLLLLGAYPVIIEGVARLDLLIIVSVGAGAVVGLLLFSRLLRAVLQRHGAMTHSAMVGLLLGSVGRLWPWRDEAGFAHGAPIAPSAEGALTILAGAAVGGLIGWGLTKVAETE